MSFVVETQASDARRVNLACADPEPPPCGALGPHRRLEPCTIPELLLDKRLVSERALLEGDVSIRQVSQRHRNYQVTLEHSEGFFVKQGSHEGSTGTLAREARMYALLTQAVLEPDLRRFLPRVFDYDPAADVLILEEVSASEDLLHYHERFRRFPSRVGEYLGEALASLHAAAPHGGRSWVTPVPECGKPMALRLQRPELDVLHRASAATLELMQLVHREARVSESLDALGRDWKSDTLIHCDVKLANVLLERSGPEKRFHSLKLVDWEFAGLGDPSWDVGSVFAAYLSLWVSSIPMPRTDEPARLMDAARFPLQRIQPLLQAFWTSYSIVSRRLEMTPAPLDLVIKMTAARLLHTVYELALFTMELSGPMLVLAQLAINIFERPEDARIHLFGIR